MRSKIARAKVRSQLGTLRQLCIALVTQARYDPAAANFFVWVRITGQQLPPQLCQLDTLTAAYVQHLCEEGDGRSLAQDVLSALQHRVPRVRHQFTAS